MNMENVFTISKYNVQEILTFGGISVHETDSDRKAKL